jgi:hypothetical protein
VTGESGGFSFSERDYATVKYGPSCNEQWVARYAGPGNGWDSAYAVAVDSSGKVYVTGEVDTFLGSGTSYDYATLAYDTAGNQLWLARYDGPIHSSEGAADIAVDGQGKVYVTGWSYGAGTYSDFVTIKYAPETDSDGDGVVDSADNCRLQPNPDQQDADTDSIGDVCDNCAAATNAMQTNTDGDQWGDACDYCPTTSTPWEVPTGDQDCDGFTTAIENYLGTDPLDACPDDTSDDAWPLDIYVDGVITVVDDAWNFRDRIGETGGQPPSPNWWVRLDFDMDNFITVTGDVFMYKGMIGETCS